MKRIISLLAMLCLLLVCCACDGSAKPTETPTDAPTDAPTTSEETPTSTETPTVPATEPSDEPEISYELVHSAARLYRNEMGEVWVQGVAEVKNTCETSVCLQDGTFVLEAEGKTLAELDSVSAYPQIIEPGESAYYYEEAALDTDYSGELTLNITPRCVAAKAQCIRYSVTDTVLRDSLYGGVELIGKITNDTGKDGSLVCIAAVLLDGESRPIGQLYTYLTEPLKAGTTVSFGFESFMLPEDISAEDVAQTLIFAYPLQQAGAAG